MTSRVPSDVRSIKELMSNVEDNHYPAGSTIEVSIEHPDFQTEAQIAEVSRIVGAAGLNFRRNTKVEKHAIFIHPPEP